MSSNHKKIKSMLKDFYPYAKKTFGFDKAAKIVLNPDQENSKKPLGKTAFYDPQNYSVTVYTHNRHPKDIMRSISHELVHHTQNCRGDLTSVAGEQGPGYAQNNDHLREMEREAYEQGNLCFRDWEDGIKSNLEPGTIYEKRRTTNMATVKDHLKKRDALRVQRLFEKFGYKTQMSEEHEDSGDSVIAKATAIFPEAEVHEDGVGGYEIVLSPESLARLESDPAMQGALSDAFGDTWEMTEDGIAVGGMSDEDRRTMYDDEQLSDYDDIREKKYKREDKDEKLSDEQSDEMDKDKDGDIDGEDLKALRKNESLEEAFRNTFRKNPKLIKTLQESGLSNSQIIKKVLEYGDHGTQAQGGMVSSSHSSDPEMDQVVDIVKTVTERGMGLHDFKQALEAEGFDVEATPQHVMVSTNNGTMAIASVNNVELEGDEEIIESPDGSSYAVGWIKRDFPESHMDLYDMDEGFRGSPEEKEMTDKMSNKEFYKYHTRDKHIVPDLKGDMGPIPGMEGPFQFKSGAVLYYDNKAGKYYNRGSDMYIDDEEAAQLTMEQEEQEDQAGSNDEVAAAKQKGMKSDVQRVAKFMFNHKQLGPALEKLKGDNVEVAQLLALLSQEMGVDPADLSTLVTKVKGEMNEAEGEVFEVGEQVVDDRNGKTGTVTEPMAGGAVIKLDDGEIVKVRDKFLSKVEPTIMKEFGEEDEEATTYSDLTREQIDMIAASLSGGGEKTVKEYGYDDEEDPYSDVYHDSEMAGLEAEFPWMKEKKPKRGRKQPDPEEIAAMQAALADSEAEYAASEFDDDDDDEFNESTHQPRMGEGFGFTTDPLQEWWDIRNDRKANKFFEWAVKNK